MDDRAAAGPGRRRPPSRQELQRLTVLADRLAAVGVLAQRPRRHGISAILTEEQAEALVEALVAAEGVAGR